MDKRRGVKLAGAMLGAAMIALVALPTPILARPAPGSLDRSFADNGKALTRFPSFEARAYATAIGEKGRIVTAGSLSRAFYGLARYRPSGRLDPTLEGNPGGRLPPGEVKVRLFPERTPSYYNEARGVAIGSNGRITAAGGAARPPFGRSPNTFGVVRLKSNGKLDGSFSRNGKAKVNFVGGSNGEAAESVVTDGQGRTVVAGHAFGGTKGDLFAIARFRPHGRLDPGFGNDGKVITPIGEAYSLAIDSKRRIVVAGTGEGETGDDFVVARYRLHGRLDTSFGDRGVVRSDFGTIDDEAMSVAVDSKDRIVVAGFANRPFAERARFALARYTKDGELDRSFGNGGLVTTRVGGRKSMANAVAIDSWDRIVAAGWTFNRRKGGDLFALARYRRNGKPSVSFGDGGTVTTAFNRGKGRTSAESVAIDAHGRIVAAGYNGSRFALARYIGYRPR